MELIRNSFEEVKTSKNPELINEFLIKLGKNPKNEYLNYLDFFIKELGEDIHEKIKLNLIFVLGEIGSLTQLNDEYLHYLSKTYHKSDRWVRNEIIQAINKISRNTELNEKTVKLISNALNDEYSAIKFSTVNLISNLKSLPDNILKSLMYLLNSKDSEIIEGCRKIFKRIPQQPERIFNLLNKSDNYQILKPRGIRSLLLIQFKSIINTESFREMISNSSWDNSYKENYIREINTFERILIKNM